MRALPAAAAFQAVLDFEVSSARLLRQASNERTCAHGHVGCTVAVVDHALLSRSGRHGVEANRSEGPRAKE